MKTLSHLAYDLTPSDAWAVTKFGNSNSYQLAPRAEIFRRDSDNVVDMETFQYIMQYNDYLNDPYAMGNPYSAVCARGDLTSANFTTYDGIFLE